MVPLTIHPNPNLRLSKLRCFLKQKTPVFTFVQKNQFSRTTVEEHMPRRKVKLQKVFFRDKQANNVDINEVGVYALDKSLENPDYLKKGGNFI